MQRFALVLAMGLAACGGPKEFTCTCSNSFDDGAETELYSEPFFCNLEESDALDWVNTETQLCAEYGEGFPGAYSCTCECTDGSAC